MPVLARLEQWQRAGAISAAQHDTLAALVRRERFSVFLELNALLYLGVLSIAGGIAWTVAEYAQRMGDVAIVSALTCAFAAALAYCFVRAHRYTNRPIEHEGLAFDYVLYLGCLLLATDIGYIQSRLHPFQLQWDHSLLLTAMVFFALAYRFDNRFVLSLALSSLAGWFGVRLGGFSLLSAGASLLSARALRAYALSYGALVAAAGTGLHRAGVKPHFLETYLHVAANVLFLALLSGVGAPGGEGTVYLLAVLGLAAAAIVQGVRFKRFAFVVYGVLYGYAGISSRLLREVSSFSAGLWYFVVSGVVVVAALVALARRFGRDS